MIAMGGGIGLSSVIAAAGMFPSLASAIVMVGILWTLAVASISFYSLLVLRQPVRSLE